MPATQPRRKPVRPRSARVSPSHKRIKADKSKKVIAAADRRRAEFTGLLVLGTCGLLTLFISSELLYRELPHLCNKHLFGPTGAMVGGTLLQSFGVASFVICLGAWYHARRIRAHGSADAIPVTIPSRKLFAAACVGFLLCWTIVLAMFWGRPGGGIVGEYCGYVLVQGIGPGGALSLGLFGALILTPLVTGRTLRQLLEQGLSAVGDCAKAACITAPKAAASSVAGGTVRLWDYLLAFVGWLGDQILHVEKPEPVVKAVITKGRSLQKKTKSGDVGTPGDAGSSVSAVPVVADSPSQATAYIPEASASLSVSPEVAERVPLEDRAYDNYVFPSIKLLSEAETNTLAEPASDLQIRAQKIAQKLADFNIQGRMVSHRRGPVVTLFEFEPAPGVKVGRITSLQDDLAMSLRASVVRIVAPLPGKGTVGIEVPNHNRDVVRLREVIESEAFSKSTSLLSIPIGKDISGIPIVVDIASMPHLLIAGATGTGKSVCINAILVSLLYKAAPRDVGLILIDPKILELSIYEGIPHLRVPVVTVPRQAKAVLDWAVKEMDRRYRLMQRYSVRNIDSYNRMVSGEADPENDSVPLEDEVIKLEEVLEPGTFDGEEDAPERIRVAEKLEYLPKIVIVIDELADLMLQVGREIEELITRLAQKARAAGIHLILATQRPSVDVITGLIKANFPARLSFRVTSRIDSRTILDSMGAERLLGKGDMLFMSPGANPLRRVHGAFVSDAEVKRVVNSIKSKDGPCYDSKIMAICDAALQEGDGGDSKGDGGEAEYDPFYDKAVELVIDKQQASTSMVQRVFRIGYNRAARMVEMMERDGIVGPMDGVKQREVLVTQREYGSDGD